MVRQPWEKLSTTEARTHPDVIHPQTMTVSTPCLLKYVGTAEEKKIDGAYL